MKTFRQLKVSLLSESSNVKSLVGKTREQLLKLNYSKFPLESDPELKELSYKDRLLIMRAKDEVFATSKDKISKDNSKDGKSIFNASGAGVGDYTTLGRVSKISSSGVTFDDKRETLFSAKNIGNDSVYLGIKKIAKGTLTKKRNIQKKARDIGMGEFSKKYRLD